jgi:DNA-binding CsgD family transcriptional regulator
MSNDGRVEAGVWSGREGSRQLGPPAIPAPIRARERHRGGETVAGCVPEGRMMAKQKPTRRQLEVLRSYIRAGSVAAAAYELGISETTVRQHLSGLYRRTGCLNAAQAAYCLGRRQLDSSAGPATETHRATVNRVGPGVIRAMTQAGPTASTCRRRLRR